MELESLRARVLALEAIVICTAAALFERGLAADTLKRQLRDVRNTLPVDVRDEVRQALDAFEVAAEEMAARESTRLWLAR